ncbi:uncharacterized protein LOC101854179 [Aplysia californica]|uniref:Uncharacterized protein LOC101854179 n=2 Tax=Aplysia californica TaxID=6500 RepID=A0ABM1VW09_APLCA|nr:uncharacterized protein LOC101854179 [Aplysia californica]
MIMFCLSSSRAIPGKRRRRRRGRSDLNNGEERLQANRSRFVVDDEGLTVRSTRSWSSSSSCASFPYNNYGNSADRDVFKLVVVQGGDGGSGEGGERGEGEKRHRGAGGSGERGVRGEGEIKQRGERGEAEGRNYSSRNEEDEFYNDKDFLHQHTNDSARSSGNRDSSRSSNRCSVSDAGFDRWMTRHYTYSSYNPSVNGMGEDTATVSTCHSSDYNLTMPAITNFVLEGSKVQDPKNRPNQTSQGKRPTESMDYEPNPDVVPFQPANFIRSNTVFPPPFQRSSTILKKVPIPKRHLDTFGGYEYNFIGRRGVMLHTDRYQQNPKEKEKTKDQEVDFIKSFDGMTQRERLQAGIEYMEAMRGTRRRREMVPHRAKLDLIMGGKQIEFEERFDIAREIQKLKAIAMPKHAKDLFHGRGIHLPNNHLSVHPHPRLPMPNDLEDEVTGSAPPSMQNFYRRPLGGTTAQSGLLHELPPLDGTDSQSSFMTPGGFKRSKTKFVKHPQLPGIKGKTDAADFWDQNPRVSMFRERRTVSNLSARLGFFSRLHREGTNVSRSTGHAPPPSRDPSNDPASLLQRGAAGPPPPRKTTIPAAGAHGTDQEQNLNTARDSELTAPTATSELASSRQKEKGRGGANETEDPAPGFPLTARTTPVLPQIPPISSESKVRPTTEEKQKPTTPHPLRGVELITSVPQDEQEELRQTFQRLDTDADGHIKYQQLKSHLPKHFSFEQEKFTEEVYNMSNSITFFGIEEFMIMDRLSKTVENLTDRAAESFSALDFSTLPRDLLKYLGKFDEADTGNSGKISHDSLRRILSDTVGDQVTTDPALWDNIQNLINTESTQVTKIEYIAHIPLYLSFEKEHKK